MLIVPMEMVLGDIYVSAIALVCSIQWFFWSNSIRQMVYWNLQCGKSDL